MKAHLMGGGGGGMREGMHMLVGVCVHAHLYVCVRKWVGGVHSGWVFVCMHICVCVCA